MTNPQKKTEEILTVWTELKDQIINLLSELDSVKTNLQAAHQKINDLQQELAKEQGWWDEWLADNVQFMNTTLRGGGKQQVYCFLPERDIYELIDRRG